VLVRQTVNDCLHEALDADGLVELLADSSRADQRVVRRVGEPSPLSHGILTGRP